jgi:calcineurin-like phosphoesterase family protein
MDIWFTSDLHLGHGNILREHNRPFDSIDEMNDSLLSSINRRAKTNDILYILGDVAFRNKGGFTAAAGMVARLRCKKKRLVLGNHDRDDASKWAKSGLFESVTRLDELDAGGFGYHASLTLCHYPLLSWSRSHYNGTSEKPSIMIHGHLHSSREDNERNRAKGIFRYDCGVDANDYAPVHIADIISFFEESRRS